MKFKLLTAFFVYLIPQHLIAGWLIQATITNNDPQIPANQRTSQINQTLDGVSVRSDITNGQGKSTAIIHNNVLYNCTAQNKTCMKKKFTGANSMMSMLGDLSGLAEMTSYSFKPTGKSKTIAGKSCKSGEVTMVMETMGMGPISTKSQNCYFAMDKGYVTSCTKMISQIANDAKMKKFASSMQKECKYGFPIESISSSSVSKSKTHYLAKKVMSQTVSAATFKTPAGYKVVDQPEMPAQVQDLMKMFQPQKKAH